MNPIEKNSPIRIFVCGNGDSGKSTFVGHLILKCGLVNQRLFADLVSRMIEVHRQRYKYADVIHQFERKDPGVSVQFETNRNSIILTDISYRTFYKNALFNLFFTIDCVLFLIPATVGEFEASLARDNATRTNMLIAHRLGVKYIIFAVNKMDQYQPAYDEERFNEIIMEMKLVLRRIGFQDEQIVFIPISSWIGDNLTETSDNMPWFKGYPMKINGNVQICRTVLEVFDCLSIHESLINSSLRLTVQHCCITSRKNETIVIGRVERGILRLNTKLRSNATNQIGQVKSITSNYKVLQEAFPGQTVTLNIDGIDHRSLKKHSICWDIEDESIRDVTIFIVEITLFNRSKSVRQGQNYVLRFRSIETTVEVMNLMVNEKHSSTFPTGGNISIKCLTSKPIPIEVFDQNCLLGSFFIFDQDYSIGVGQIRQIES